MKLKYDDVEIELTGKSTGLEQFAKAVLHKMQKADADWADCWTACLITFDDLNPDFTWGSIEDLSYPRETNKGIYVELPIVDS